MDGDFCAFPAVADVVNVAADGISLGAVPGTGSDSTSLGDGLAEAWRYCVSLATQHFPDVSERRQSSCPARWLEDTKGDVRRIMLRRVTLTKFT